MMSAKNWQQVFDSQIYVNPNDTNYINIRVSATPDSVNVITDIRKFIGKRATRLGVGLFPDELSWFWENSPKKINCMRQFDFRKVMLEFEHDVTNVTVIKSDLSEQKMYLTDQQLDQLMSMEAEIGGAIKDASLFVKPQ